MSLSFCVFKLSFCAKRGYRAGVKGHSARIRSASVTAPRRSVLHHARRSVLLLLGFYSIRLHAGIARYAREADWALNDEYIRVGLPPVWWRGDGILSLITNPKDVLALKNFPRVPLVDFSKGWIAESMPAEYRASGQGRPRVYYDNAAIGRMSAAHFLERGFKHIAYLNTGNYWLDVERIPDFRRTIEAGGGQYHELAYHQWFTPGTAEPLRAHQQAHQWLVRTLRQLPKPIGIAVNADSIAGRLLNACDDARVAVPEEVAVLGCDNDPMICDYTLVPLSSVDNDWERIGYEGAKLLDRLMDGQRAPRKPMLIPPKGVVTRLSTNILAVANLKIARAVRFIWENYFHAIGTDEVAAAAGLSRRTLEREFRRHLGRSINEEITDVRIERAKTLLLGTSLKAFEVAQQCGFSDIVHFSRAFHRHTGTRPSRFRRNKLAVPRGKMPGTTRRAARKAAPRTKANNQNQSKT